MRFENIAETIGRTCLVKINHLTTADSATLYVKLESFNPGGSIKDRIALSMIDTAERDGQLKPDMTVVEPTSGNTGIGLAMICAARKYRCVFTMPDTMSIERRIILKAYGAELVLTPGAEGMKGAIAKAKELAEQKGYFQPMQFDNPANPQAHRETTAREIIADLDDIKLDAFVVGVGTGGTISGAGDILKKHYNCQIVAVEPDASPVLSGGEPGPHIIQGIGAIKRAVSIASSFITRMTLSTISGI